MIRMKKNGAPSLGSRSAVHNNPEEGYQVASKNGNSAAFQMVPVDELRYDHRYQRTLIENRVDKIVHNFDPALLTPLEVNHRDGHYYVYDGQHRGAAAAILGMEMVPCMVHHFAMEQEEARLFVALQTERRSVSAVQRHIANVFQQDPTALELDHAVRAAGYVISANGNTANALAAASALQRCQEMYGAETVTDALLVIRDAWQFEKTSKRGSMILGIAKLLTAYGNDLDRQSLVEKMAVKSPKEIIRQQNAAKESNLIAGDYDTVVAHLLLQIYNRQRSTRRLLPDRLTTRRKPKVEV